MVRTRADRQDELCVMIEAAERVASDSAARSALQARAHETLRSALGLGVVVDLVATGTVRRSEGKAVRVVDERQKS